MQKEKSLFSDLLYNIRKNSEETPRRQLKILD